MRLLLAPLRDLLGGLESCLERGVPALVQIFGGLFLGWWLYVPLHELLHAAGCLLGGGTVDRLEIGVLYGGELLARWISFVEAGGPYAGRLAGFDTGGKVSVHLLTTGLPFVLTLFPGVWLLRRAGRRRMAFLYGLALAPAGAPFLSLTGDAYEIGSLLLTRLPPWAAPDMRGLLVGDDLILVAQAVAAGAGALAWAGLAAGTVAGAMWAWATYGVAGAIALRLGEPGLESRGNRSYGERPPARRPRTKRAKRYVVLSALVTGVVLTSALAALLGLGSGGELRQAPDEPEPEALRVKVLATLAHDREAYTQGLEWDGEAFVESGGRYGASFVRRWRPGEGEPLAETRLPDHLFGEGLAVVEDRVIQLTWREETALVWDRYTLAERGRIRYQGEGWGLCFDGQALVMSDGSSTLTLRDPHSLAVIARLKVRTPDGPLANLNELECAEGWIYANLYGTDRIARIDPASGAVRALIDASGLLSKTERMQAEVLNGIAYNPATETYYLTGKLWPQVFEVVFEPSGGQDERVVRRR